LESIGDLRPDVPHGRVPNLEEVIALADQLGPVDQLRLIEHLVSNLVKGENGSGRIAGVDGFKEGWIAAIEDGRGETTVEQFTSFAAIVERKELGVVVIDVPIGLTDVGPRAADEEARAILKNRGCCVFSAPIRPILDCVNQREASEKWRSIEGKGCTAQLWGIVPKIAEVDRVMKLNPSLQDRIREGHPEVSFAMMNGGMPIQAGKASPQGQQARQRMLQRHFAGFDKWLSLLPSVRIDLIDAFALLWTARRVRKVEAKRLPEQPIGDRFSLCPSIFA
jgi:predicted RNase H-like nuclease